MMANDERVEAAREALTDAALELLGRDLGTIHVEEIARRALSAAGVDALEAENARLREEVEHVTEVLHQANNVHGRVLTRLDDLRAGVEALADEWADAFITGRGPTVPLHERVAALRALTDALTNGAHDGE